MSFLFSGECFGLVMTLTGCLLFTEKFSVLRTTLAVLLTVCGILVTWRTERKWFLAFHAAAWALALLLPVLPKPVQNLFTILCALALIPFVLNVLRLIIRRLVGAEDERGGEKGG